MFEFISRYFQRTLYIDCFTGIYSKTCSRGMLPTEKFFCKIIVYMCKVLKHSTLHMKHKYMYFFHTQQHGYKSDIIYVLKKLDNVWWGLRVTINHVKILFSIYYLSIFAYLICYFTIAGYSLCQLTFKLKWNIFDLLGCWISCTL